MSLLQPEKPVFPLSFLSPGKPVFPSSFLSPGKPVSSSSPRRRRGHTLLELVVACSLLLALTGISLMVWKIGTESFFKVDRKTKLLTDLQVVGVLLRREASFAARGSFSFASDASEEGLSFLSARTLRSAGDRFTVDPVLLRPAWQKYVVCYLERSSGEILLSEVGLVAGASQATLPTPIEAYDPGPGMLSLPDYFHTGRRLCAGADRLHGRWEEEAVRVTVGGLGADPQSRQEERFEYEIVLQPRN